LDKVAGRNRPDSISDLLQDRGRRLHIGAWEFFVGVEDVEASFQFSKGKASAASAGFNAPDEIGDGQPNLDVK
jgi:hypothetical protein